MNDNYSMAEIKVSERLSDREGQHQEAPGARHCRRKGPWRSLWQAGETGSGKLCGDRAAVGPAAAQD